MEFLPRNDFKTDPSRFLKKIYIEQSCRHDPYVAEIISKAGLPYEYVQEDEYQQLVAGVYPDNLTTGKTVLLLSRNKGAFLKDCPATRQYQCCGYRVINSGTGCPMDCSYCILQAYLNNPYQNFYINRGDLIKELDREIRAADGAFLRIGTGEFSDSMALDRITGFSRMLINYFRDKKTCVLELKTKSVCIDNLKDIDHNGRTIIAWSLNSEAVVTKEELRTAPLEARLRAAAACWELGYPLAFHFDPIIAYPGWQDGYADIIKRLFEVVPAPAIRWISMGGLRYIPRLKEIGTYRFPSSDIYHQEFIEGLDNKQRYFRLLRIDLYKKIYHLLKQQASPDTCIYFCMESNEVWTEVMGYTPASLGGLPAMLDRSVHDQDI